MPVRPATPNDASAIAHIHVATWRAAYRGLIPDSVLDALDVSRSAAFWSKRIAQRRGAVFVFEHSNLITGFCDLVPTRDHDAAPQSIAEIAAIYVLADHWRTGAGGRPVRKRPRRSPPPLLHRRHPLDPRQQPPRPTLLPSPRLPPQTAPPNPTGPPTASNSAKSASAAPSEKSRPLPTYTGICPHILCNPLISSPAPANRRPFAAQPSRLTPFGNPFAGARPEGPRLSIAARRRRKRPARLHRRRTAHSGLIPLPNIPLTTLSVSGVEFSLLVVRILHPSSPLPLRSLKSAAGTTPSKMMTCAPSASGLRC